MRAGEVLREAWAMYKGHKRHLISVALALYVLLAAVTLVLALVWGGFGQFVGVLISFAGVFWVQGALVMAVEDVRDGRADLGIRETIARMRPRINRLSLAALGILVWVVVTFWLVVLGLLLFVIPGLVALAAFIIFLIRWSLLIPVIMLEGRTVFGSLDRSQELVRGHTGQTALILLVSLGFVVAVSIVVSIVFLAVDLAKWIEGPIGTVVAGALAAPFAALALTLMYYRLRAAKEPVPEPEPLPAA
jgi:hypothetical protein